MVYDITNKESFDELDTFWLEKIKDNTKNIILGLAANKSDLYESEVVTIEEAKNFAKNNNAFFFETTAKNYESTRLLFIELVTKYIEKYGFVNENAKNLVIDKDKNKNKNNTKKGCCSK